MEKSPRAKKEEEILSFWQEKDIFKKSLEKESPKGEYVFYEGPPTANGRPGIHHLEARAFKDAIPRYKTMRGYHVQRKAGWDTHGLPVELEVEKELGISSKKQIEEYGVEKFNEKCKENVWKYVDEWKDFTKRIGYWVDLDDPYVTYHNSYIETVWSVVAKADERGLLYKDYKVVPWCPRCGTGLSSHELAQGYKDVKNLSVYAKFKIIGFDKAYFLAWTTTPWTLPGNAALAVGKDVTYVEAKVGEEIYVLAKDRLEILGDSEYEIVAEHKGSEMVGMEYEPLYPYLKEQYREENIDKAYKVYTADFVNTEDGTGIVHTAVMYGQDDFVLGTELGLPKHHLVDDTGHFMKGTGIFEGRFVREEETAVEVIKDLAHRGLLFKKEKYEHSYPHCWRCKTPLIYYARDSWYIKMSELRGDLIHENESINWEPNYIKQGRFGEWIREVKDWALSRERYWGTPLPVWESESGKKIVVDSFETLKKYSKNELKDDMDLHKPFIDDVVLVKDDEEYRRTPEVMDVWLDSGAMPFAQDPENVMYPADFISEAIDQTRGWFYTLHAVGAIMGKGKAYKNVICLGHILDEEGKKMSKSVGNIVNPWDMIEKHGVDVLRLWMYSVNQPGESKNFDERTVEEIGKRIFNLLENVYTFYDVYTPDKNVYAGRPDTENPMDEWMLARTDKLVSSVTRSLEDYKLLEPVREIRDFVDDLSTWYLRRSRQRLREGDRPAQETLLFALKTLSKVMAPFAPFAAEDLYQKLRNETEPESVHLCDWPAKEQAVFSPVTFIKSLTGNKRGKVFDDMEKVRNLVTVALDERQKAGIKVRQPLAKIEVREWSLDEEYGEIVKAELNVKELVVNEALESEVRLDTEITPELEEEGKVRELIRKIQDLRKDKELEPGDLMKYEVEEGDKEIFNKHSKEIIETTSIEV